MTTDDELLADVERLLAAGNHPDTTTMLAPIDSIQRLIQRSKRLKEAETLLADWKAAFESIRTTDSPEYSEPPFGMPWMFTVKFLGARVK